MPTVVQASTPKTTATGTSGLVAPAVDLQRGSKGTNVRVLQTALVRLGFMKLADMNTGPGIFGPKTEAAVKAFQGKHGVPTTGYYGPLTRKKLAARLAAPATTSKPKPAPAPATKKSPVSSIPGGDLQRGSSGAAVKILQTALVHLGFMTQATMNTGPGVFGPKTEASLKAFQSKHGVRTTGYYGPLTRAALSKKLGVPVAKAPPSSSGTGSVSSAFGPKAARLAQTARAVAARMNTTGWCAKGVFDSLQAAGMPIQRSGSAWMAAGTLARDSRFREIKGLSDDQIRRLPPGAIVVSAAYNTRGNPHGHIAVTLGGGREASDHIQNLLLLGTQRVFVPR